MLGGLMRGASGAFLRGALGTATQAIQQVNLDDQEEIKTGVEKFGSKYETYQEGLKEYNAERKNIKNVAAALSAQDDAFIKGLDAGELEGVAQSLITISGAGNDASKAIEFFLNNRDKLKAVAAPQAPSVTAADAQTDAAMTAGITPTPQPEDRSFFQKLFKGQTDDEIANKIAKKAGVTREQYDAVMSGTGVPQVGDPSMLLSIGKEDPYKKLIMDNNSNVLAAIKSDQPIYSTPEGRALAEGYLGNLAAYGAGGEGAPTAEAMLDMQSKILTAAAPPDAKTFFEAFDTTLSTINTRLNGKDSKLPQAVRDKAMPLFQDVLRMKQQAQIPGSDFGSNPDNATLYADKVFALQDVLNITNTGTNSFKVVDAQYDTLSKDAINNPGNYTADDLTRIFGLETDIRVARESGNVDKIPEFMETFSDILNNRPEDTGELPDTYSRKKADLTRVYMQEGNLSEEEAELRAIQHLNSGGLVTIDGIPFQMITDENGRQSAVRLPIASATGTVGLPRPKVQNENITKMKSNLTGIQDTGRALQLLMRNPNGFNFIGGAILRLQDAVDMSRSVGMNIPGVDIAATEIQEMKQRTIPLISAAKDRLFEDPRLSDQDLKIVLDYVAVINDEGIGTTRATAALIGLQEALAQDQAMRMVQNMPDLKIVDFTAQGGINILDQTGNLDTDSTVAGRIMKELSASQGMPLLTKSQVKGLSSAQRDKYNTHLLRVAKMTERVVQRVQAFRDLGADAAKYRQQYANQSSLFHLANANATQTVQDQLAAGRTRITARDPDFYGSQ